MCMKKESNSFCCCLFRIIASLIAAVGIAGVFYTGLITSVATLIYFTLVLVILGLLYVLFTAFCGGRHQCNNLTDSCLISSIVGSIVTSIFALTLTALVAGSITTTILIGAIAFFLINNLINFVNLIVSKLCGNRCED